MNKAIAIVLTLSLLICGLVIWSENNSTNELHSSAPAISTDLRKKVFTYLATIRNRKKAEVIQYFKSVEDKAKNAGNDPQLQEIFFTSQQQSNLEQEDKFDAVYANRYGEFYDILLANPAGFVFNSVRKEADYGSNLFNQNSPLHPQSTISRTQATFIDYQEYAPSDDSASFFFVPLQKDSTFAGWIILQCPINRINRILSKRDGLGRSGEVYLVNKRMLLLSDSRFINESSALKLKVDTEAARNAMVDEQGEQILEDYRGVRVFSSFERFDVFGATWIIIAEIDEAEILTKEFLQTENIDYPAIVELAEKHLDFKQSLPPPPRTGLVVDINEFKRSADGDALLTYGVASCTAILILLPERFAYLTHISPLDEIYQSSSSNQNLLHQLLHRITYFDLLPVEKRAVQFVLIAPHNVSLKGAVATILEHDFDLGNIRLAINRSARGANVTLAPYSRLFVEWYGNHGLQRHDALTLPTLQDLFSELVTYQ